MTRRVCIQWGDTPHTPGVWGRPPRYPALRHRRRLRERGFTLIELTVAMLAGLLVAMSLVAVSKEANNTFHEEVRAAGAEMALRVTLERLRNDLQRVAYMSTGNIAGVGDPTIAHVSGIGSNTSNLTLPVAGISRLAGIQLQNGGSAGGAPLSANPNNNLNPDSIDLAGNFSTTDEFPGFMCPPPASGCGSTRSVCLEYNTPAMWRIRTSANPAQTLQSYFNPSFYNSSPSPGVTNFMARITDDSAHYQFLLTCSGANTTTFTATGASVNIAPATRILAPLDTGGHGGVGGLGAGRVVISPVEIVHWQIQTAASIPAGAYSFNATAAADPNEYVLTRTFVDALSNQPDLATTEVVAEYAVDLKFSFTVNNQNPQTNPPGAFAAGTNPYMVIPLDSVVNSQWAYNVAGQPFNDVGPHRIRSVRVRAAIRTAFPDRTVNIQPQINTGQPYMYRYFIPGVTNGLQWARVRTGVTEASLPNQARFYY